MPSPDKQATLFCRVSSPKQAKNFSTESQERLGREYAERQGLTITRVFRIVETASKGAERAQWNEYLEYVRRGPERHALVATVDRASRNFHDQAEVMALRERFGKVVHFFLEGLVLDGQNRAATTMRYGVMGTFAAYYAAELSEKTRRGLDQKALKGQWPNRAPYGYLNDRLAKRIVVDPEKARWVRRIKELSAEARHSLDAIVEQLWREGCSLYGHRLHRNLVERVIRSPLYAGRYEWAGQWVCGEHEAIVSWQLHEAAVAGLEREHRPRYRRHRWMMAGLVGCECGRAVVFESKKGGRFTYAHCSGTQRSHATGERHCPTARHVAMPELERQVREMLAHLEISEKDAETVRAMLAEDSAGDRAQAEMQRAVIRGQLTRLADRATQAYADKLDGKIEEGFWLEQKRGWGYERVRLEEALRAASVADCWPDVSRLLELAKDLRAIYDFATDDEKRLILEDTHSNWKLVGKNLCATIRTPFAELAEGRLTGKWLRD